MFALRRDHNTPRGGLVQKTIECSNCEIAMLVNADVLTALRRQAIEAPALIGALLL
jgi:hypothetical protein